MALTESKLRSIIQEEARRVMGEGYGDEPEDFGAAADGGYDAREKMGRHMEMGDEDDDSGDEGTPVAVEDIVHMFRQRYRSMDNLASQFSPYPGEVKFESLVDAVESYVRDELDGGYDPKDIEAAADIISMLIQDYTIARRRRYRD